MFPRKEKDTFGRLDHVLEIKTDEYRDDEFAIQVGAVTSNGVAKYGVETLVYVDSVASEVDKVELDVNDLDYATEFTTMKLNLNAVFKDIDLSEQQNVSVKTKC